MTPFITFYTPTYRRPQQLARCLESVRTQTAVEQIEQIVIPDHIGIGVGGMYGRVAAYVDAVHGAYVHMLCDDDVLADPSVVEQVAAFAVAHDFPPVILVKANKGGNVYPQGTPWPPHCGAIDLGCVMTRADVWKQHAKDYAPVYEGDYWHMKALADAGHQAVVCDLLFCVGGVSRGQAEVAA